MKLYLSSQLIFNIPKSLINNHYTQTCRIVFYFKMNSGKFAGSIFQDAPSNFTPYCIKLESSFCTTQNVLPHGRVYSIWIFCSPFISSKNQFEFGDEPRSPRRVMILFDEKMQCLPVRLRTKLHNKQNFRLVDRRFMKHSVQKKRKLFV